MRKDYTIRASVIRFGVLGMLMGWAHTALAVQSANYVIHISVDGLRPTGDESGMAFLQDLIDAGTAPNFQRFQDQGAWTNNARTDFDRTITIPNHTSILTGRPVSQPTGFPNTIHHGYVNLGFPDPEDTLHNQGNPNLNYIASVFDVAHDSGLSTALYASKAEFSVFDVSYNATNGADHPNGKDKIDTYGKFTRTLPDDVFAMHAAYLADMQTERYRYSFVHYLNPDSAGHTDGWGSASWQQSVKDVDGYLGDLFDMVDNDPVLNGNTVIILTADHGGQGLGHSSVDNPADYTIPFYVWGAGVANGDLYDMNFNSRTNPGGGRPDYTDPDNQPIRNGDSANLALSLLGLSPIPGSLINADQDLRTTAFGDLDLNQTIDVQDWLTFRSGHLADLSGLSTNEAYLLGDLDGDGDNDVLDFNLFKGAFDEANGAGQFQAMLSSSVPEPATGVLVVPSFMAWCLIRRSASYHETQGEKIQG